MANIGVVLSGGIAKGAYEIGFFKALQEYIDLSELNVISGSSVGSIVGYAAATGQINKIEELWKSVNINGARQFIKQIIRTKLAEQYIDDIVIKAPDKDINVYCTCCEMPFADLRYVDINKYDYEMRKKFMYAALALSPLCKQVEIEGKKYIDGAYRDNLPIAPCYKHALDYILIVHFDTTNRFESLYDKNNTIIQFRFPMSDGLIKDYFDISTDNVEKMINFGYTYTNKVLKQLFKNGTDNLNYIKRANRKLMLKQKFNCKGINIDTMLNIVNSLSSAFRKNKIAYMLNKYVKG